MVIELKYCSDTYLKTLLKKTQIIFWLVMAAVIFWYCAIITGGILCACAVLPSKVVVAFALAPILTIWPIYILYELYYKVTSIKMALEEKNA